jgi:exopolysaccharide biosynthesis polyprenyl glycosylphosphotransferase
MIMHRRRRQFALFVIDIALLYLSLYTALWLRTGQAPSEEVWLRHAYPFSGVFLLWALVFYTAGLYMLETSFAGFRFLTRLALAVGFSFLVSAFVFYILKEPELSPKTILALQSGLAGLFIWVWRYLYYRVLIRVRDRISVTFIGSGADVDELVGHLRTALHLSMDVRNVYKESSGVDFLTRELSVDGLSIERRISDVYVIKESSLLPAETRAFLFSLVGRGPHFISLPDFYELILRRVPIATINDLWFLDKVDILSKKLYLSVKRGIDIVLALLLLITLSPIICLAAFMVKLSSPGPVIYKQIRLGQFGKEFVIWKLRTMRVEGNDGAPTGVGDTRITVVGRVMRALRIDELPQIINILNGDMSFIGPRPERPELAEGLRKAIPFYMERLLVKPGVTGWDQVSGEYHSPSIEDTYKKLQYDLYYIKNLSPLLDISIFFKTIMTVLSRSGR